MDTLKTSEIVIPVKLTTKQLTCRIVLEVTVVPDEDCVGSEDDGQLKLAIEWLTKNVKSGTNSNWILKKSKEDGIALGTLRRAKRKLGIKSVRVGDGWNGWDWVWPA